MSDTTVPAHGSPRWIHAGTLHLMAAAAWMSILLGCVAVLHFISRLNPAGLSKRRAAPPSRSEV